MLIFGFLKFQNLEILLSHKLVIYVTCPKSPKVAPDMHDPATSWQVSPIFRANCFYSIGFL